MSFPNESSLSKKKINYRFPSKGWTKEERRKIQKMLSILIEKMEEEKRKGGRNFVMKPMDFAQELNLRGIELTEGRIKGVLRGIKNELGSAIFTTRCKGGRKNYHFKIPDALPKLRKLIKKI